MGFCRALSTEWLLIHCFRSRTNGNLKMPVRLAGGSQENREKNGLGETAKTNNKGGRQ